MNIYLKIIVLLGLLVGVFGIVGPYLVSAANTELVLGGLALIFLVAIPLGFKLIKGIVDDINIFS